jgi:superfamily II DNA or RNA helicase
MRWTEALEPAIDEVVRARGEAYERQGRVHLSRVGPSGAEATVLGTRPYRVWIQKDDDGLDFDCTCPSFEGFECKHVWATLVALDRREGRRFEPPRPGLPAAPSAPPPPAWQVRLAAVASIGSMAPGPGRDTRWPEGREVVYEIDVPATLEGRGLVVGLFRRDRRRDGSRSRPKALKASRRLIDGLPEASDREALSILLGAHHADAYLYDPYEAAGPARFRLDEAAQRVLVPRLCATGRCVLRLARDREPSSLAWDEGEPWRFELRVKAEDARFVVEGVLRRGDEERPVEAPALVTSRGLVFMDGRAALFEHGGAFGWVSDLRRNHRLEVPRAHEEKLRATLLAAPSRPPLEVPEEMGIVEVREPPRPRLRIAARRGASRPGELEAEASFQYGDAAVPEGAPGWAVPGDPPRVHVRDAEAERAALARLAALGARRATYQGREEGPRRLSPARLGPLVVTLAREGWHVEAEGRLYRRPGQTSLRVSSGIDWFDVEGAVDFEGQKVTLPRLLQALRRGESAVVLDDGSVGMLPEEWLRGQAALARFGAPEGDALRFHRSQAGLLDALLAARPEVATDAAFERARAALRRFEGVKPEAAPPGFAGRLRGYQRQGLGWMAFLREFGFGGCLADDMGLGKTVQVLALLEGRRGQATKPSLVVVPRSLVFNWKEEAARFAPRLRVADHTGLERAREASALARADVVLTTYGTLRRDAALLTEVDFDYVVLDEAQSIKNRGTESAKAARLLRADHRLALSGTPVENHLGELQSLFDFLNPGLLGRTPLARGDGDLDEEGRAALARGIAPFILRRTKAQVAKDLPPKTEQTLWCDLEPEQKGLCDELRDHYRASILESVERQGLARSKMHVLEALLRMRQAACHPGLVDPRRKDGPSAKLDALLPRLVDVVEEGHKALVFSQFTSFLALLKPRLQEAGLVHEYLDGRTRDRAARVRRFETDEACRVFLVSLKAGGLGLNLTAAEYVFLLDPWWNPAVEAQAIDRTHRIGQTRPVFAYRLVARGTVEEKVLALQETKRALADAIVRADEGLLRGLRREDLELLLA